MNRELVLEPIQITPQFRAAIEAKILELERNAASDELVLRSLTHPDHRRRQEMLIERQLERSFRLREMLALVTTRAARSRREPVR
jgi:hypothetical protein